MILSVGGGCRNNIEQVPQGTSAAPGSRGISSDRWRICHRTDAIRSRSRSRGQGLKIHVSHAWNHESCSRL